MPTPRRALRSFARWDPAAWRSTHTVTCRKRQAVFRDTSDGSRGRPLPSSQTSTSSGSPEKWTAVESGWFAPTSDYTVYATALAMDRLGIVGPPGIADLDTAWRCLHKGEFGNVMESIGFRTAPFRLPTTLDGALAAGEELGYPVILKPRSHVGVGLHRGTVVRDAGAMAEAFGPLHIAPEASVALERDADLGWPMVQRLIPGERLDIVSIAGCLDRNGELMSVGLTKKLAQWPPEVGIGTLFEAVESARFLDQAIDAVRATMGTGVFELEVCVDRGTDEAFPIDLNPRAFGQVAMEIARGNDLPAAWYEVATGVRIPPNGPVRKPPTLWQSGMAYYSGVTIGLLQGPDRRGVFADFRSVMRRPRIGPMLRWTDPLPGIAAIATALRNPTGLVVPYLSESTHAIARRLRPRRGRAPDPSSQ